MCATLSRKLLANFDTLYNWINTSDCACCGGKDNNGTKMIDEFEFTSPIGILGRVANSLVLKAHDEIFKEQE